MELVEALIPAAGAGSRMGGGVNKPFLEILGVPILVRTLQAFEAHEGVAAMTVMAAPGEESRVEALIAGAGLAKVRAVRTGGATRQATVLFGLRYLAGQGFPPDGLVLVHDGARPLVTRVVIDACIDGARRFGACGAAVPVKDTIKRADPDGLVRETLDRSRLFAIQTPQAFRFQLLLSAHESAAAGGFDATDDLALLERAGGSVRLVAGDYRNLKVTTPEDLRMAEALAAEVLAEEVPSPRREPRSPLPFRRP